MFIQIESGSKGLWKFREYTKTKMERGTGGKNTNGSKKSVIKINDYRGARWESLIQR